MPDPAHKAADASLEAFSGEIAELYQQAYLDAVEALQKYLKGFEADDRLMRKKLASGELKQSDYREWRNRQMVLNKRYRTIVKQMAEGATNANKHAMDILAGRLPHIAAENANYAAYTIDKAIGMSTNFALQDADTVAVMLKEHGRYLPKPNLDIAKDMRWNRQLLSSALTKGILLGESIPKISKRVSDVIGGSIPSQVMRVARTCVTAAENAGRIASYDRAESIGIELKKEWLATLDMRTRSSHRLLDGEQVANDEKFSNGCEYPGDPNCEDYGEIANCRCTMVAAVNGVDQSNAARWSRLPDGMTYDEWKCIKQEQQTPATQRKFVKSDTVYQAMD